MTIYDTARDLQTAGVQISAYINPAKLTVRMRNSVKRMLLTGIVKGSYYSHAARINDMLIKDNVLSNVRNRHGYIQFRVHRAFNDQERELLNELFDADKVLNKIARSDEAYTDWIERHHRDNLRLLNMTFQLNFTNSIKISNDELNKQALEIIAGIKTPEEIELRKQLCEKFDSNELIPIEITI